MNNKLHQYTPISPVIHTLRWGDLLLVRILKNTMLGLHGMLSNSFQFPRDIINTLLTSFF